MYNRQSIPTSITLNVFKQNAIVFVLQRKVESAIIHKQNVGLLNIYSILARKKTTILSDLWRPVGIRKIYKRQYHYSLSVFWTALLLSDYGRYSGMLRGCSVLPWCIGVGWGGGWGNS